MIKINIADLPGALGKDLDQLRSSVLKEMRISMHTEVPRMFQEEIARTKPRQPVDRGTYKASLQVADMPDGGTVAYSSSPYAGVLELGRRKGGRMPPVAALEGWVLRKGITKSAQDARGIAFAIARKMKTQGWPFAPNQPMRILGRVYDRIVPVIDAAIARAFKSV